MGQPSDPRGRWILCLIAAIAIFAIAFVMRTAYCVDYDYVSGADGQCRDNLSEYWRLWEPVVVRVEAIALNCESCRSEPQLVWLRATWKAPSTA